MKKIIALLAAATMAGGALAQTKPFNISLVPDVALYGRSQRIDGLTLSIWGENPQTALALGFVNGSTGDSAGFSWAFLLNYADNYKGVQWAAVNYVAGDFLGWQAGILNYTDGLMKGLQTGWVNYAGTLTGLQFGFVNYAETAESGVQIGLVNLIPSNPWFSNLPDQLAPGMIFVNWGF